MAGMTTVALVSGNTVLLKPASTTPVVAEIYGSIRRSWLTSWRSKLRSR